MDLTGLLHFHDEATFTPEALCIFGKVFPDANRLIRVVLPQHENTGSLTLVFRKAPGKSSRHDALAVAVHVAIDRAVTRKGAVFRQVFNL
nr:MAG TPA: hypothetical protein [Caudoviricetes sp.]